LLTPDVGLDSDGSRISPDERHRSGRCVHDCERTGVMEPFEGV
jgi:hypothetical protein